MSKAVQRRRGTTAEHTTFTGALGELTVDTTKDTVVVHDGAAAGGYPLAREDLNNVSEIPVSKLADGAARQLLQTAANGTDVEWTNNVDVPGTLDVTGLATFDNNVTIAGDLTVNGATTTINSTIVTIDDKLIELGSTPSPTDAGADQGGIVLKGTTDKSFKWVDATDAWTSSEHIDLASGKQLYINGTAALPGLAISGSPTTGLYSPGANQAAITTGGTQKFTIDSLDGNAIIENSFPTIRPSLDLAFALTKVLDPRITFTRSSDGTYTDANGVLRTATTNIPRFDHNPTTGESLGLLVEEQRTNLLARSEELGTTWTPANLTVTSNSETAPNGTTTADTLVEDTATSTHVLQQAANVVSGTAYTLSCYAKPAGRNFAQLLMLGGFAANITAIFDITTGAVGTTVGSPTVTSTNVGNGWYRLSITATATSTTSTAVQLRPSSSSSSAFYQGDGTSGIYVWGAQLEAGAFPTSYIPTTTATVTRSADVASITGTNFSSWYNQNSGTVYAEYRISALASGTISSFDDGTANNRWQQRYTATALRHRFVATGSNIDDTDSALVPSISVLNKAAYAATVADQRFAGNGTLTTIARTQPAMPVVTQLQLGVGASSDTSGQIIISRLRFWPARLSDATLQALTK